MIDVRPRWDRALRAGWVAAVLLRVLSVPFDYAAHHLHPPYTWSLAAKLNVDAEGTLPTRFSSALILACALVQLAVAALERARRGPCAGHWLGLGLLFTVVSAEEVVDFRTIPIFSERVGLAVRDTLGAPWLLLGIPFVVAFVALNVRFLRSLPAVTRSGFILAGATYVGGAVAVEAIAVVHFYREGYDLAMVAMVTVEEWMEMAGMLLLLGTMLRYLRAEFPAVALLFDPPAARAHAAPALGTAPPRRERAGEPLPVAAMAGTADARGLGG
jgi:hypothetical protein